MISVAGYPEETSKNVQNRYIIEISDKHEFNVLVLKMNVEVSWKKLFSTREFDR